MTSTKKRLALTLIAVVFLAIAAGIIAAIQKRKQNKEGDKKKKAEHAKGKGCFQDEDCPTDFLCVQPGICAPIAMVNAQGEVDTNNNNIAGKGREGEHIDRVQIA